MLSRDKFIRSPKYMLLKMTASHLKEIAIECFQGNKCTALAL